MWLMIEKKCSKKHCGECGDLARGSGASTVEYECEFFREKLDKTEAFEIIRCEKCRAASKRMTSFVFGLAENLSDYVEKFVPLEDISDEKDIE